MLFNLLVYQQNKILMSQCSFLGCLCMSFLSPGLLHAYLCISSYIQFCFSSYANESMSVRGYTADPFPPLLRNPILNACHHA